MPLTAALDALSAVLGQRLSRVKSDLDQHARSETHFPPTPPHAVAWPETTQEVAQILAICTQHRCPVIGWGAGTSLEGHALAVQGGLVVDFGRMDKVLQVRPADMDVTVQPGITREALDLHLRDTGLFFPVDPGANATLGGMAATRASGTTTVRYGSMRDNVLGLEAVLAGGRVIRTGSRARKSAAGYDLTRLLVGSEGTLGLMTELTLRLHGRPEAVMAAICGFARMQDAVAAVIDTIQLGLGVARIEFMDPDAIRACNAYSGASLREEPLLLVEFHGSPAAIAEQSDTFAAIARDHGASHFDSASRPEDRRALWTMRHNAHYAIMASRPGARALVTDICVPISRLAEAVEQTRADIRSEGMSGPILGHMGDGNFHAILLIDPKDPGDLDRAKRLAHRMAERALALGGTVTGEHGIGIGKLAYMAQEHGEGWAVMGQIKRALDPDNILNPGKLVPQ